MTLRGAPISLSRRHSAPSAENSPGFQPWECPAAWISPEGTVEIARSERGQPFWDLASSNYGPKVEVRELFAVIEV
jgi:hypothetical protein